MGKQILAKDCKCCKCGKEAVAFWPIIDPDIQENPYCRKCLDESKHTLLMEMLEVDKKYSSSKPKTK